MLVGIALLLAVVPARAEKLTKAEIGKLGKAATAFVEVPGRGSGTAFCVHPSGLFVTNEHVVRGQEKTEIKIVIDASLKTQRVLPATIVRLDKERDLALLRVAGKDELPSLTLGSLDAVSELSDVVAFGFPLGAALSTDKKEYPAMSVNAGNVSALRRKAGEVQFLQIDISVTFGSSGGPVLDENGKVIGVIVSGVPGQRGINLAIPVSHLNRFLDAPEIQFTPPELTRVMLDKPLEFTAKVVSVVPSAKEPKVSLLLQAGDEKPREFPMVKREGVFVATAVPVPSKGKGRVEISIRYGTGAVTGLIDDIVIKIGGKSMKLSEVNRIEWKPKRSTLLANDKILEGEVEGLGSVELSLGEEKIRLDLRKAMQVQVTPTAEVGTVTATIVAKINNVEVAQAKRSIQVKGPPIELGAWTKLGGTNPFPSIFEANAEVLAEKDGLRMNGRFYTKSTAGDYLAKDFRFELVYTLKSATTAQIAFIGIGEADRSSAYNEPKSSVFIKIHPPNVDGGWIGIVNGPDGGSIPVGKISKEGTHRIIMEKRGEVLTFAIDVDNDGPSDDDMEKIIPKLTAYGPFLHKKNSHIFFGGGGLYKEFRISK